MAYGSYIRNGKNVRASSKKEFTESCESQIASQTSSVSTSLYRGVINNYWN